MKLAIPTPPIAGESLQGLICRAAASNFYTRAVDVLTLIEGREGRVQTVAGQADMVASDLAQVLGTATDELHRLFYPVIDEKRVDFFGAGLRKRHLEPLVRRVSPRALKNSPHVRAIWHVRPIGFDPHTKERLLTNCPVCGTELGFIVTRGVAHCDLCERLDEWNLPWPAVDLRDYPQPLIEVEDTEALDFVTSLIDPEPEVRAREMPPLNDALTKFNRGQLFELAVALGSALMLNVDKGLAPRPDHNHRGNIKEVDPLELSQAGRALLDWPRSFIRLCETQEEGIERRGTCWGTFKEVGAIANLRRDAYLNVPERELFVAGIAEFFASTSSQRHIPRRTVARQAKVWISGMELAEKYDVAYATIKKLSEHPDIIKTKHDGTDYSLLQFLKMQADPILRNYKDLMSEASVAWDIGVPLDAVRDFAYERYLDGPAGLETYLSTADVHYRISGYDELFGHYQKLAPRGEKKAGYITFSEAMLMFPAGRRPWFALWEAIFMGRVDAFFHKEPTKGMVGAMSVRARDIDHSAMMSRMQTLPTPDLDKVTIGNAKLMLGVAVYDVFAAYAGAGLLTPDEENLVPYAQIMDFAKKYILPNEIGMRSQKSRFATQKWLKANRVSPAYELPVKSGLIFNRESVEQLLASGR